MFVFTWVLGYGRQTTHGRRNFRVSSHSSLSAGALQRLPAKSTTSQRRIDLIGPYGEPS